MAKLSEEDIDEIKADILIDLLKHTYVGARHTSYDNIPKGFPKSVRGNVKKVRNMLKNEEILIVRPSKKGYSKCSINPLMMNTIISMPKIIEVSKHDELLKKRIKQYSRF